MRLKGGHYLEEAVALSLQDSSVFVMEMYQTIAERHNKGVASIEQTYDIQLKSPMTKTG